MGLQHVKSDGKQNSILFSGSRRQHRVCLSQQVLIFHPDHVVPQAGQNFFETAGVPTCRDG